jgi:hypothetical protein
VAVRLKPLYVERETKPGKYADGDGLYLIVFFRTADAFPHAAIGRITSFTHAMRGLVCTRHLLTA